MKKLLAFLLLSAISSTASALEPQSGVLIDISAGYTPSILATDGGISEGGYIGYKFNPFFSVEGGYTSLLSQSSSGANTVVSIVGSEVAGILRWPINNRVSPFFRVGFSRLAQKTTVTGSPTSMEIIYGPSYGLGLQFYETDHVSLRMGYSSYELQTSGDYNVQGGIPVTTSNYYLGLVIQF
jgi:hypothetical protein